MILSTGSAVCCSTGKNASAAVGSKRSLLRSRWAIPTTRSARPGPAKELLRRVYTAPAPAEARRRFEAFHHWARQIAVPEIDRLSRTLRNWQTETLNYHLTRITNGPTEALNLLIEKTRRIGHGYRNWNNYRLRLLLHCGVIWQTPRTKRIRGRNPPLAA